MRHLTSARDIRSNDLLRLLPSGSYPALKLRCTLIPFNFNDILPLLPASA